MRPDEREQAAKPTGFPRKLALEDDPMIEPLR